MKYRLVKDLKPGDTFLDSFGLALTVEAVIQKEWNGIPGTAPRVEVRFITPSGNHMWQFIQADRIVEVTK